MGPDCARKVPPYFEAAFVLCQAVMAAVVLLAVYLERAEDRHVLTELAEARLSPNVPFRVAVETTGARGVAALCGGRCLLLTSRKCQ